MSENIQCINESARVSFINNSSKSVKVHFEFMEKEYDDTFVVVPRAMFIANTNKAAYDMHRITITDAE